MSEEGRVRAKLVLYHGSLAELNSRDPSVQYEFPKDPNNFHLMWSSEYTSEYTTRGRDLFEARDVLEGLLRSIHLDGLVDFHTSFSNDKPNIRTYLFEGTPIIRVDPMPETGGTQR